MILFPAVSVIDLSPTQVFAVHRSLNVQPVALGVGPMTPANATVISMYTRHSNYRIYVFLGLTEPGPRGTLLGQLFVSQNSEIPLAEYNIYENAAHEFCDQQGFQMERIPLENLPSHEQAAIIMSLPFDHALTPPPLRPDQSSPGAYVSAAEVPRMSSSGLGSGLIAMPVEISREITIAGQDSIRKLGRLLSLF